MAVSHGRVANGTQDFLPRAPTEFLKVANQINEVLIMPHSINATDVKVDNHKETPKWIPDPNDNVYIDLQYEIYRRINAIFMYMQTHLSKNIRCDYNETFIAFNNTE